MRIKKTGIYAFRKNRQILLIGHETMEFMKISASYAFKNCKRLVVTRIFLLVKKIALDLTGGVFGYIAKAIF